MQGNKWLTLRLIAYPVRSSRHVADSRRQIGHDDRLSFSLLLPLPPLVARLIIALRSPPHLYRCMHRALYYAFTLFVRSCMRRRSRFAGCCVLAAYTARSTSLIAYIHSPLTVSPHISLCCPSHRAAEVSALNSDVTVMDSAPLIEQRFRHTQLHISTRNDP